MALFVKSSEIKVVKKNRDCLERKRKLGSGGGGKPNQGGCPFHTTTCYTGPPPFLFEPIVSSAVDFQTLADRNHPKVVLLPRLDFIHSVPHRLPITSITRLYPYGYTYIYIYIGGRQANTRRRSKPNLQLLARLMAEPVTHHVISQRVYHQECSGPHEAHNNVPIYSMCTLRRSSGVRTATSC